MSADGVQQVGHDCQYIGIEDRVFVPAPVPDDPEYPVQGFAVVEPVLLVDGLGQAAGEWRAQPAPPVVWTGMANSGSMQIN